MRTTIEKKEPGVRSETGSAARLSSSPPISNSAAMSMMGIRDRGASLSFESKMNQRFSKPPVRRQAQIPHAENEADRLSAAINSGTPETVKADMGRRMGADFSSVTFHTDPAAAAKADAMGARAYTTGSDIYFGSEGFNPKTAAHELVHTAQQGMVDSGVSVAAAPAGGIQMDPKEEEKKRKGPGSFSKAWDKTGGRFDRWTEEAIDELHAAKTVRKDGTRAWDDLTKAQKAKWKIMHPRAHYFYQNDAYGPGARYAAQRRADQRKSLDRKVGKFLKSQWKSPDGPKRTFLSDADLAGTTTQQDAPATPHAASMKPGEVNTPGTNPFKKTYNDFKEGNTTDGLLTTGKALNTLASATDSAGKVIKPLKDRIPKGTTDIVGGVLDTVEGMKTGIAGTSQRNSMTDFSEQILEGGKTRDDLDQDKMLKHDIGMQGITAGKEMQAAGFGQAAQGVFQTAGGIMKASGVAAPLATVAKALQYGAKAGTAIATHVIHDDLKTDVTKQTTGIDDQLIYQYMDRAGMEMTPQNVREVKRAMMRYMGYKSGYREELLSDQSEKRAKKIAEGAAGGDAEFDQLADNLGSKNIKEGQMDEATGQKTADTVEYDTDKMRKRLGAEKSRAEVVNSAFSIEAMSAQNRARRAEKAAQTDQRLTEIDTELSNIPQDGTDKKANKANKKKRKALNKEKAKLQKKQANRQKKAQARVDKAAAAEERYERRFNKWMWDDEWQGKDTASAAKHKKSKKSSNSSHKKNPHPKSHHHTAPDEETSTLPTAEDLASMPDMEWLMESPRAQDSGHKKKHHHHKRHH